jgi:hypothetical protein
MRNEIRRQAEFMGYEVSDSEIEAMIDSSLFHMLVTGKIQMIRAAIRAWFDGE